MKELLEEIDDTPSIGSIIAKSFLLRKISKFIDESDLETLERIQEFLEEQYPEAARSVRFERVVIFLEVKVETNKFKRAWIWFWYNDITRICILMGLPIIPVVFTVGAIFGFGEYLRGVAMFTYAFTFGWALLDNDYSNLRRIGMNEDRKKI